MLIHIASLRVFRDLVKTRSFTTSAEINGTTQPAVSRIRIDLERSFKSPLIEQGKHKFGLTAEGQVVYDFSKRIVRSYDVLQIKLKETRRVVATNIRVASVFSIGLYDLPPFMKRFHRDCPEVNLHVAFRRNDEVYEEVLGNRVDLGLVAFPERNPGLKIEVFRRDPLVLACHPQHRLAKLRVVKLKALDRVKMVGFEPNSPMRNSVDRMCQRRRVNPEYVMECDSIEALNRAVEIGLGIAVLPERTIANRALAALRLEDEHFSPLGVI